MIHIVVWVSLLLSVLNWVLFAAIAFSRARMGGADVPTATGTSAAPANKSGAAYSAAMLSIFCLVVALVAAGVDGA